jgi:glutamate carboxypeptidase
MAAVTSHGRASHAGTSPGEGRNAILALAEFLLLAQQIPATAPGVQINAGFVAGGGPINVVPDRAEAKLDVRVDSAAGLRAVQAGLETCAARIGEREGHRVEVALHFARPPLEAGPAAQTLFAEWARCGRDLGLPAFQWRNVGGGSDANLLGAAGLPCLDGLGPRGGGYHSADEWIDPRTLAERAQLAALFLHRLATGAVVLPVASTP